MATDGKLRGRVIVVAGAGGAAGPVTVRRLVDAGATVVAAERSLEALEQFAGLDNVEPVELDLTDEPATLAWGHEVRMTYGQVDGLLHLVGGWRGGKGIVESDLADWDFLHESLIRTLQHTTRAFHDALKESTDGRLAIISSTGLDKPTASNAAYLSAKAATETWVRAVADSFTGSHAAAVIVRVMALLTPAMREASPDKAFKAYTPVEDVAEAFAGLWDEQAGTLNGQIRSLKP